VDIPFVGGAYKGRSIAVDGQETVNFYLEYLGVMSAGIAATGATATGFPSEYFYGARQKPKATTVLYSTPGLKPFNVDTDISGADRGLYTTSTGRCFKVTGNKLLEYTIFGQKIPRGTLKTSTGMVSMADCGNGAGRGYGLCIVDGQFGYNFNLTNNTFEQILDTSFIQTSHIVFMNGYFIICEANSARFWFSQLYNCLDWSDLQDMFTVTSAITSQTGLLTLFLSNSITENAVNVQTGVTYTIVSLGTTDWASMGDTKPTPAVGDVFVANNLGNGTGTCSYNPLGLVSIDSNMYATVTSSNAYLQGYTQYFNAQTGELQISVTSYGGTGTSNQWVVSLYEGSSRFYTAEGTPDNLKTIATIRDELWLIGEISTEVWYNPIDADVNNPFTKRESAFINNGTVAEWSAVTNGNSLFWLGSSAAGHGQVWLTQGYQPLKISTNSIDYVIESLQSIQDAIAFCYTQNGHEFYVLSFTEANKTFCYDTSTGEWAERAYWNAPIGKFERYLPNSHCVFNGTNLVSDYRNSNLYSLDLNTYTDNGQIVRRVRTGPHVHSDRKRVYFKEFEIDIERGVGLDGTDPTKNNPIAFLTWSDDGGYTWANEYWNKLGKRGEYKTRLHWHRLGFSRDRVFRLVVSDPVKIILLSARADILVEGQPIAPAA
jgi:Phage stabilisation protein